MSAERSFAVIPAAGKSTRMGRPKLALPLGDRSVLERVLAAVRAGGVSETLVVLGPHVRALVPLAEAAGAHVLLLADETPDMRATVEHGLRWLEEHFHPAPEERWLLLPADHPTLDAHLVRRLLEVGSGPDRSIVIPSFQGKRGHPAVLVWRHVAALDALPRGLGLNAYFRQQGREILEVPVASSDVLCDLDTPADYERLRQRWERA